MLLSWRKCSLLSPWDSWRITSGTLIWYTGPIGAKVLFLLCHFFFKVSHGRVVTSYLVLAWAATALPSYKNKFRHCLARSSSKQGRGEKAGQHMHGVAGRPAGLAQSLGPWWHSLEARHCRPLGWGGRWRPWKESCGIQTASSDLKYQGKRTLEWVLIYGK